MKILVTGGTGLLGSALKAKLPEASFPTREELDLSKSREVIDAIAGRNAPDVVIHLAGKVGGIQGNSSNQYRFFYENLMINTNVLEACRLARTPYVLTMSSVCCYPRVAPSYPITEGMLHMGAPEPTNCGYAHAKRAMQAQCDALRASHNMNIGVLYSTNLYGPGDHFGEPGAHVIPDLFHKLCTAESGEVELYGTGKALRQFTYVDDLAEAIKKITESRLCGDYNIGNPEEVSIETLVDEICRVIGFDENIKWSGELEGQLRRTVSMERLEAALGPMAWTSLREGLEKTYRWYNKE
jgi:GDP-L-fucose synthase